MKFKVLIAIIVTFVGLPATYVASPFITAWSIREAVKSGDSAYLARKIDFAAVRETLAPSLTRYAFDIPNPDEPSAAAKPGLWKRVKSYWGGAAINRFAERYITAEGLPKIFQMRQSYRDVTGSSAAPKPPLFGRLKAFWSRIERAEFITAGLVEIEMRDQYDDMRHHICQLQLRGMDWTLVSVKIKKLGFEDIIEDARFDPDDQPETKIE